MKTVEMNVKNVQTTSALQKQLHEFKEQRSAEFHLTALATLDLMPVRKRGQIAT